MGGCPALGPHQSLGSSQKYSAGTAEQSLTGVNGERGVSSEVVEVSVDAWTLSQCWFSSENQDLSRKSPNEDMCDIS